MVDILGSSHSSTEMSTISKRGQGIQNVRDDIGMFHAGAADPYDPVDNPDGYLVMLIAENKLMWKEMAQKIETTAKALPEWVFTYGDFGGDAAFKESMGRMMNRWIQAPVDPQYLRFQAGAGSVLAQLSYILTDPGDGVLQTGPGYPAFVSDFGVFGQAVIHIAETQASNNYEPTVEELNKAYDAALQAGNPPKILIICQPNNPTGSIYSPESMKQQIEWALSKNLHVVSDEIYALSTFPGYTTTSAADIMRDLHPSQQQYLGDRVHVVAGLSKDWGMSGFRVGSLLTHNNDLLKGFDIIDYYEGVSSYTQFVLTGVFQDDDFVDWYIAENQKRLHETYGALEKALALIQVPLYQGKGAIFAWADFSGHLLPTQTEKELWEELFRESKIIFTTGYSCYEDKPGMFRIVYGWPEGGAVAMEELGRRLVKWSRKRTNYKQ